MSCHREDLPIWLSCLKLCPKVSPAVLKTRQDNKLAPWYAIRTLSITGHDFLNLRIPSRLVFIFCYSQKTVYQAGGEVSDLLAIAAGDSDASSAKTTRGDGEKQ